MADWSDIAFAGGQDDYILRLNALLTRAQATATEVESARIGETTLTMQIQLRLTQAQVDARINTLAVGYGGMSQHLNAGGYRIQSLGDPASPQDAATRGWVLSQITLGGDPSGVPVTSLHVGALSAGQLLMRVGAALAGVSLADLPVTGLGVGSVADGELVVRSGDNLAGRALDAIPVTSLGPGTLAEGQMLVRQGGALVGQRVSKIRQRFLFG